MILQKRKKKRKTILCRIQIKSIYVGFVDKVLRSDKKIWLITRLAKDFKIENQK